MFCKRNICSSYPIILQRKGKESADGKMEGVVQPQQSSFCYLFGLMLEGFVRYLEVWNLEKSDRADSPELVRCSWALSSPPLLWEGILCSVWMRKKNIERVLCVAAATMIIPRSGSSKSFRRRGIGKRMSGWSPKFL